MLHTGRVIEVELDTLVSLAALAGFGVAILGYLHTMKRDLRAEFRSEISGCRSELKGEMAGMRSELKDEMAGMRSELKGDIAELRREMKQEFAKVEGRLTTLEQRTYDLSTRLPPAPAQQP